MSICSLSLGLNWKDQALYPSGSIPDWQAATLRNVIKVADYVPGLSIISGLFKIAMGLLALKAEWSDASAHRRCDLLLYTARGVVATLQLGILLLPVDAIMTVVNGILSYKSNRYFSQSEIG